SVLSSLELFAAGVTIRISTGANRNKMRAVSVRAKVTRLSKAWRNPKSRSRVISLILGSWGVCDSCYAANNRDNTACDDHDKPQSDQADLRIVERDHLPGTWCDRRV